MDNIRSLIKFTSKSLKLCYFCRSPITPISIEFSRPESQGKRQIALCEKHFDQIREFFAVIRAESELQVESEEVAA